MSKLDFSAVWEELPQLIEGCAATLFLAACGMALAIVIGIGGVALRGSKVKLVRNIVIWFVEIIRNTPFLVQIFFILFALPNLDVRLNPTTTAILTLGINGGAYAVEIIRGGVESISRAQIEAGLALGLNKTQVFRLIILRPAIRAVYPSLTGQFVMLSLTSSITSSVGAHELTSVALGIDARTFRSFEVYFTITGMYLLISWILIAMSAAAARRFFSYPTRRGLGRVHFGWNETYFLLQGLKWTFALVLISFAGGSLPGLAVALLRSSPYKRVRVAVAIYVGIFQGTPTLMQLFAIYYGVALFEINIDAWAAVAIAFLLHASAFLGDIWRGSIEALPVGQKEAADALGLHYFSRMKDVTCRKPPKSCCRRRSAFSRSRSRALRSHRSSAS